MVKEYISKQRLLNIDKLTLEEAISRFMKGR